VRAEDVAEILGRLDDAGTWYCIEGGWGVDALLGEQTREHRDLDLGIRQDDVERMCAVLEEFERDDAEWPSAVVFVDERGRRVDAHPLTFDENGDGWQANLSGGSYRWPGDELGARGQIGGREVRCITPELQLRWHEHDDFDDLDWADMSALAERFDLPFDRERPRFASARRKLHSRDESV
jgi:lincosamide nucleotidyltransferase A/C/D/E